MRKTIFTTAACCAAALSVAHATYLVQDDFPTNGSLVGTTPATGGIWTTISGSVPALTVVDGLLSIAPSNGQDAGSQYATPQTGEIFAAFDFTLTTAPSTGPNGSYIAAYRDGTIASGSYIGRFFILRTAGTSVTEFQIGVTNTSASLTATGAATWATNLTLGSTYRIVMRFDTTTDQTTLWVDPLSTSDMSITATDAVSVTNLDGYAFRQDASTHGGSTIGDLAVATTFDEVAPVPEPGTVALVGIGLGAVLFGLRRRS
jgi:hypothetical protein